MTLTYDLTGNTIVADAVEADVTGDITGTVTGSVDFPAANLADPGTNLTDFDKALKITVNGTDYWLGLYDDND